MEISIQKRNFSVYGVCNASNDVVYVGRWERGSAIETKDGIYKAVDYGWLSDCLYYSGKLYAFGYYGLMLEGLCEAKRIPMIGTYVATDGRLLYAATENALSIYDYDLHHIDSIKLSGVRDVNVADGVVYVLGRDALYIYSDGKLRPVYKLSSDAGIAYYVLPDGDDIYVSALSGVVRLDAKTYRERAFAPRLGQAVAVAGDYLVSLRDNAIIKADRSTLSIVDRRYVSSLSVGFAKAHVINGHVITPAYFRDENVVLTLTL